jgi:hypothetical protein
MRRQQTASAKPLQMKAEGCILELKQLELQATDSDRSQQQQIGLEAAKKRLVTEYGSTALYSKGEGECVARYVATTWASRADTEYHACHCWLRKLQRGETRPYHAADAGGTAAPARGAATAAAQQAATAA